MAENNSKAAVEIETDCIANISKGMSVSSFDEGAGIKLSQVSPASNHIGTDAARKTSLINREM